MNIARTLTQLQIHPTTPARARELGHMGYMQWLGGLPGDACYRREAERALAMAAPFRETDPAIAEFCALLLASLDGPQRPLNLSLPKPQRRGGAQERRLSL